MNQTRSLIAETASRLFADFAGAAADPSLWREDLWRAVDEMGLTRPLAAGPGDVEAAGFADAAEIIRAAGRYAVPLPLPETILASWLIASAGLPVPEGPLTIASVTPGPDLRLSRRRGGWKLSGIARTVPWGRYAMMLIVALEGAEGSRIALANPAQAEIHEGRNLAGEPRDDLVYAGASLSDDAVAPMPARLGPDALFLRGALSRAWQIVGALERVLELCVQYAGERVQFGRPIGKFQAIQHGLAVLAGEVAAARAAAAAASALLDEGEARFAVAAAKLRASEAAGSAAAIAHQVHGAIGFTQEYPLHQSTRRLWSWRDEFGRENDWGAEIGRAVSAQGADALWPFITDSGKGMQPPPKPFEREA